MSSPAGDIENPIAALVDGGDQGTRFSLLTACGFTFLTFNSAMAVYRSASEGDPVSACFVALSYVTLVLLFRYLRMIGDDSWGGTGAGSRRRRRGIVWACVWVLTALLAVMLAWKVAQIMPLPMAAAVWIMTVVAIAGLFWAFGCFQERRQPIV